ncbi:MAG TPA: glutathione binding-like protein, partial [Solirubrobacteraceae bacterium]|nr:glutathione binding-like protein [Solirubrobacteraceae bacterium]
RRYVFHMLRGERELFGELATQQIPPPFQSHPRVAGAYARVFTGARFQAVSDRKAHEAFEATLSALDRLESELGENEYLIGDRFTVADLTAAALFYPLVLPPEGPVSMEVPGPVSELRDSLAGRRGYQWVTEMFARHRAKGASRAASSIR